MKTFFCDAGGCIITPSFNFKGCCYGKYCSEHKKENMINVKNRTCLEENCISRPIYNIEGEKLGIYCKEHKKENMIYVLNKYCSEKDCKVTAAFNFEGKSPLYCSEHKKENMINVRNKSCKEKECKGIAHYNYQGEVPLYCKKHKKENMFYLNHKKCDENGCFKNPNFNYEGKVPLYCFEHKKEKMINVRCTICKDCKTYASYNYKNKKALYCAEHKKENMINVNSKTCLNDWCDTVISKKYKGYCFYCFINQFPYDQLVKNYKMKEKSVVNYIKEKYPNYTLHLDKIIQDGCSKKRPDILLDLGYQVLIIEIDEHKHISYSCENKRIMELSKDVNHRPIIMIRFNPDNYNRNKIKITSCWKYNQNGSMSVKNCKKDEWKMRLNTLSQTIDYWLENKSEKTIHIIHLFYDTE
jgi:hypothetical protein